MSTFYFLFDFIFLLKSIKVNCNLFEDEYKHTANFNYIVYTMKTQFSSYYV